MKIGKVDVAPSFALAPMAGMTDTAFRRLVKRQGGCGLVVTEMVSSEGLVRRIDSSHFDPGTAYMAVDYHLVDNRDPFVFKTGN